MPYLECPKCRLKIYSAARYSSVDLCPGCQAPLARGEGLRRAGAASGGARSVDIGKAGQARRPDESSSPEVV